MENTLNSTEFLNIQKNIEICILSNNNDYSQLSIPMLKEMNNYLKVMTSNLKLENKYLHLKKDFYYWKWKICN